MNLSPDNLSRRAAVSRAGLLAGGATVSGAFSVSAADSVAEKSGGAGGFILCLNTALHVRAHLLLSLRYGDVRTASP
jgi:hypothetical protein